MKRGLIANQLWTCVCTGQSLRAPRFPASRRLAASARLIHAILACREDEDDLEARAAENQKILFYSCATKVKSCQFAIGYVSSRGNRVIRGPKKCELGETGVEKGRTRHGPGLLQRAFAGHAVVVWLLSYSTRESSRFEDNGGGSSM